MSCWLAHSCFSRRCYALFHLSVVTLIVLVTLAWSLPAFCGEIHDAAQRGELSKVKMLLKSHPDLVSSKDKDGTTPLDWAVVTGHKAVAELLLTKGAKVNAQDSRGMTPLHHAVIQNQKAMIELLLAKGVEINAKASNGWTPLDCTGRNTNKDVLQLLRQNGGRAIATGHLR